MQELRAQVRRHGAGFLAFADALEALCGLAGGRLWYRKRYLARDRIVLRQERIEVRGLPSGLDGLRIAHLSDLHAGRFLRAGDLAGVVEAVNAQEPDVIALTGDYISHHWSDVLPLVADLGRLRSRLGTFAVFGNHDYRDRQEQRIVDAFAEAGVRFLRNSSVRLTCGEGVLALTGLEDLEESKCIDLAAARAGLEPGDVEVLLCHNPQAAQSLARTSCAAVLSGHTHGTQIDLPWLRRLGPAHPGLRIEYGPTTSIVSRGIGVVALPLRIGSPAEVVIVELAAGGQR